MTTETKSLNVKRQRSKERKGLNAPFELEESWLLILPCVIVSLVDSFES